MKKLVMLLLLLPGLAAAEIHQCADTDGRKIYSDRPCSASSEQAELDLSERDWVGQLRTHSPQGVDITSVKTDSTGTVVKYGFERQEQSNEFIRAAAKLGGQDVALLKYLPPSESRRGSAQVRISSQMPNLLRNSGTD